MNRKISKRMAIGAYAFSGIEDIAARDSVSVERVAIDMIGTLLRRVKGKKKKERLLEKMIVSFWADLGTRRTTRAIRASIGSTDNDDLS